MSARDEHSLALGSIHVESGVSHRTGEPFCRVSAQGLTRDVRPRVVELVGQLPPAEVRTMALGWLAAAEAAITDAAVFGLLTTTLGMPPPAAMAFLGDLRAHRADLYLQGEGGQSDG